MCVPQGGGAGTEHRGPQPMLRRLIRQTSDPVLRAALVDQERAGLRFALVVRTVVLVTLAVWLLVSVPMPRVTYWLGFVGLFLVSGFIPYAMRHTGKWRLWFAAFATVDAILLVTAMLLPNPLQTNDWPVQMGLRFHNVLYLFVLLAGAALSYSPFLVVWTGFSAAAAWSIGTLLIAIQSNAVTSDPVSTGDPVIDSQRALETFLSPTFVNLGGWMNEVVLLMITAVIMAAAVWRARTRMVRQVKAERARTNLARYISPDLTEQLAQGRSPFEASEQRKVAVLFVDMIGFTRLAEETTPERTITMLRGFHRRMAEAVFACGGTVDKYAGDSVMATFGALGERPDDALRAVRCAQAMVLAVDDWNAKRQERGSPPVRIGIGVHYGDVVVGNVGEQRFLQFTVIGDTVNVASRIERLTRDHGARILASVDVVEAAQRGTDDASEALAGFREAGVVPVRGRQGEIALWRLDEISPAGQQVA